MEQFQARRRKGAHAGGGILLSHTVTAEKMVSAVGIEPTTY
jgi:hypothetical protein